MGACYKCGEPFMDEGGKVNDESACTQCSSWLHSCGNCLYYDEYSQKKCREARAPYIFDRLGKNECAFFKVKKLVREERIRKNKKQSPRGEQRDREGKARENLDKLFKI